MSDLCPLGWPRHKHYNLRGEKQASLREACHKHGTEIVQNLTNANHPMSNPTPDTPSQARPIRVILSGGGTAGHIHPALATADALRSQCGGGVKILFVGALGKMEMERVPKAGYDIEGLPVAGLQRRLLSLENFALPFKIMNSIRRARAIIRKFKPDVVAGFGGYASAPVLFAAQRAGIPTLIQEQNSFAGLTNKLLARRARRICTAYDGMERFFPRERIVPTGNPLRGCFDGIDGKRGEAIAHYCFKPERKTILVLGGSLGTRTLNRSMMRWLDTLAGRDDVQVIWQSGRYYEASLEQEIAARPGGQPAHIWRSAFIERMDMAYAAADVVISRAGASTVSELELVGRAVIFVPSPNVAEDHQTHNARSLVERGAALMVTDAEAEEKAIPLALKLLGDDTRREAMALKIKTLGRPAAASDVAREIIGLAER